MNLFRIILLFLSMLLFTSFVYSAELLVDPYPIFDVIGLRTDSYNLTGQILMNKYPTKDISFRIINFKGHYVNITTGDFGKFNFDISQLGPYSYGETYTIDILESGFLHTTEQIIIDESNTQLLTPINVVPCNPNYRGLVDFRIIERESNSLMEADFSDIKEDDYIKLQELLIENIDKCYTREIYINLLMLRPDGSYVDNPFGINLLEIPRLKPGEIYRLILNSSFDSENPLFEERHYESYVNGNFKDSFGFNGVVWLTRKGVWELSTKVYTPSGFETNEGVISFRLNDSGKRVFPEIKVIDKTEAEALKEARDNTKLQFWALVVAIIVAIFGFGLAFHSAQVKQRRLLLSLFRQVGSIAKISEGHKMFFIQTIISSYRNTKSIRLKQMIKTHFPYLILLHPSDLNGLIEKICTIKSLNNDINIFLIELQRENITLLSSAYMGLFPEIDMPFYLNNLDLTIKYNWLPFHKTILLMTELENLQEAILNVNLKLDFLRSNYKQHKYKNAQEYYMLFSDITHNLDINLVKLYNTFRIYSVIRQYMAKHSNNGGIQALLTLHKRNLIPNSYSHLYYWSPLNNIINYLISKNPKTKRYIKLFFKNKFKD